MEIKLTSVPYFVFFLIMQPISAIINLYSVILFILQAIICISKKLKLL